MLMSFDLSWREENMPAGYGDRSLTRLRSFMYFQSMSVPLAVRTQVTLEAIHACDRLAPKLLELIGQHEHAASIARPDWCGPHRDTFEDRFASAQRELAEGERWVLQIRHEAVVRLAMLRLEAAEEAALLRMTGPR